MSQAAQISIRSDRLVRLYYDIRPLIPRSFQIMARRFVFRRIARRYSDVWPINRACAGKPEGWKGWPDGKDFALLLSHDVEKAGGQEKCLPLMEIDRKYGFLSAFNFVPERYNVLAELRERLTSNGLEVGVHGLLHDGKLYKSRRIFNKRAVRINKYLKEWNAVGFRSPSMQHNLNWISTLDIEYDSSTFDADPFETQCSGLGRIFPVLLKTDGPGRSYVEIPYTLPQDFTLFVILMEPGIDTWKRKLDWIVENGGMALLNTHPDYMNFDGKPRLEEYPASRYVEFLTYIASRYRGRYWNVLPREISRFWRATMSDTRGAFAYLDSARHMCPVPANDFL